MLIAALGVGVFAAYVRLTPSAAHVDAGVRRPAVEAPIDRPKEPVVRRSHEHGPDVTLQETPKALAFKLPKIDGDNVSLGGPAGPVPQGIQPAVFLATETMKVLKIDGAKALTARIDGRNAIIEFTPALEKGYGSTEEGTLIKALQTALGQVTDFDTFQLAIEGKTLDTLGQIDLSEPIPVIRDGKEVTPAGTDPAKPSEPQDPAPQN